ncbi:hypothetical protein QQ020_25095 [Fulvivirgaceae bacterium BMA12]|uniref:Secreted protein n=1 Tax=Agaribacillus aureus TaxID=3051825 RepID=A0ABT8LC75_9BACT|nr:hypothetical protein [Fulvivirgaceae bacterium BMA12]
MNRLKKIVRILIWALFILLASMGIGAPISFNSRERYMDREIRIEQVEKKDEESDAESTDELKKT